MNKQALKLKQKRRAQKEAEKNEKINKVWEEVNQYDNSNYPKLKKTKEQMLKVYKATKDIDSKILSKAAVITLVCSLNVLHKEYSFDKDALLDYSKRLRTFIISITSNNRPITQILEEIELDYNVSIMERCKTLPTLTMAEFNKYDMDETIIKSSVGYFPYFIAVNVYTFMNYLLYTNHKAWNSGDLEKFVSNTFKLYKNILLDSAYLLTLKNILCTECFIDVNLNSGTVKEIINN